MLMFLAIVGGIVLFILFLGVLSIFSEDEVMRQRSQEEEEVEMERHESLDKVLAESRAYMAEYKAKYGEQEE